MTAKYDFSILRRLRHNRNLTLEELAQNAGLSYPTVASVETNKAFPSLKTIDAIADALEVPTDKLFALAIHKKPQKRKTESIHANELKESGINLKKINVTTYDKMKIFRATAQRDSVVNSMKLHDDCDCHELCYCLSGAIDIRIGSDIYHLCDDDVIFFDGSLDHEYTPVTESEYLVIHMPGESIQIESLVNSATG